MSELFLILSALIILLPPLFNNIYVVQGVALLQSFIITALGIVLVLYPFPGYFLFHGIVTIWFISLMAALIYGAIVRFIKVRILNKTN